MRNTDDALNTLMTNMPHIIGDMTTSSKKLKQAEEFIANPKNKLLIYGPTPESRLVPWFPPGTRIKVGSISLSKSKRDVELELGRAKGQGGRMVGLGHSFANQKNQGSQWFRMDWHKRHGSESYDWYDGSYHFHTETAP